MTNDTYIHTYSHFLYLAILYLAKAVTTMSSPRNNRCFVFYLAVGTFWEWPACEIQVFTTKIRNSNFGHGSGRILNFATYPYLFDSKIQNSKFGRAGGRLLSFASDQ